MNSCVDCLRAENAGLRQQIQLSTEPCVIDEVRWLDERNAGAVSLARTILSDDGAGTMSEGPCRDLQVAWRKLKAENDLLKSSKSEDITRVHDLMMSDPELRKSLKQVKDLLDQTESTPIEDLLRAHNIEQKKLIDEMNDRLVAVWLEANKDTPPRLVPDSVSLVEWLIEERKISVPVGT